MAFISPISPISGGKHSTSSIVSPIAGVVDCGEQNFATGCDFAMDGNKLKEYFHLMFREVSPKPKRKSDKKKHRKKPNTHSAKIKHKLKNEAHFECNTPQPTVIEMTPNPSTFSVFANVRQSVLEQQLQDNAKVFLASCKGVMSDSESEEEDDKSSVVKLPKVVGIGLHSVFELIKESQYKHSILCNKALQALLGILQGLHPEALKAEPADIIDTMFSLLMELATSSPPHNKSSLEYHRSIESISTTISYACSCLLTLVVAHGNTEKILSACAALLMSSQPVTQEIIKTPDILTLLQRSVHAVLLGNTCRPDWFTRGITDKSQTDSFLINTVQDEDSEDMDDVIDNGSCIASDGINLYVHNPRIGCLYKVGSGYGGTIKGLVYAQKENFHKNSRCWLGYAKGYLYFKPLAPHASEIKILSCETLKEEGRTELQDKNWGPSVMFSDGDNIGHITSSKDDSFVVQTFKPGINQMICIHELPLKLARKCLDVFGTGLFDDGTDVHSINTGTEDEVCHVAAGKDYGLIKTTGGKILFSGKSQSLGIKQSCPGPDKWLELPMPKSSKIVQYSVGHDGLHSLLVADDGIVYFTGTARRGEDGDQSKSHRQSKASKPKKMSKLDGQFVVHSACNHGTSAVVTKHGELYMFGKDTAHCDHTSGQVLGLKDVHVIQVALGKAHAVALSKKGHVYTFGINNKGQCGRDFFGFGAKEVILPVPMSTANEEECEDEELELETDVCAGVGGGGPLDVVICTPGKHRWAADQCMVCTVCGECTGYGASCVSSTRPDRNPGLPCGCGVGDSGCSECGCCRSCAKDAGDIDQSDQELAAAVAWGSGMADGIDHRNHDALNKWSIMLGKHETLLQDYYAVGQALACADMPNEKNEAAGTEQDREASKVTSLPPAKLLLPTERPIIQISCGLYHTVILAQNGDVFTFGSNQHGQLGVGDLVIRGVPTYFKLPVPIISITTGSNHSVLLSSDGQVFTFGSYQKGQLGRFPPVSSVVPCASKSSSEHRNDKSNKDSPWYSSPGVVPNIGIQHGRRATWIGASGDQTFIKIDESLINAHNLFQLTVVANKQCIGLIPSMINQQSTFNCLFINKIDGNCKSFCDENQVDLRGYSLCLDPVYSVLWSFNPCRNRISCYNVISGDVILPNSTLPLILKPELAIPSQPGYNVSCSHAALHLLCCLNTLSMAQDSHVVIQEDEQEKRVVSKVLTKEDFSSVNRFESHGGGWGYSGHSIESIRFMADTDIVLGGFGLFGGRGDYAAKVKLFDIGMDGGEQETDGELLAETDEIPFECGARHKFPLMFDEHVSLQSNRWYIAWARISGPSSDCGSSGQAVITTDDQVTFYFKSSRKSNNGTDVNAGQIPQILYRVVTSENESSQHRNSQVEPVCIISQSFSTAVTPGCFYSLLKLLDWTWQSFKSYICEIPTMPKNSETLSSSTSNASLCAAILDLKHLLYICTACLQLLRIYVNKIYPKCGFKRKQEQESDKLAECVADCRDLLHSILSDKFPQLFVKRSCLDDSLVITMLESILDECHATFVSCYYAFYPTSTLKWHGLCELLTEMDMAGDELEGYDRMLAAFLGALCNPAIRIISVIPMLPCDVEVQSNSALHENISDSVKEISRYPTLVEVITSRSKIQSGSKHNFTHTVSGFKDFLDRMLAIVIQPVRQVLGQERITYSSKLVSHVCSLLSLLIAELTFQTTGTDKCRRIRPLDIFATGVIYIPCCNLALHVLFKLELSTLGGKKLHVTPGRFTRISQHRTWNTGNGSPDAICISVDKPGIFIIGVCVYGGIGSYEYELEILDDQTVGSSDPLHTQRWNTLEITKGTFTFEECANDIIEVRFEKPVLIKENVKYAIRFRNHGSRTSNGDGGLASVKGPDGTTFSFSACSLSFNGTNRTRGQVPQLLYYSSPQDSDVQQNDKAIVELHARKCALDIVSAIVKISSDLLYQVRDQAEGSLLFDIGSTHIISMLLPLVFAHIGPLATSDPRSAVKVIGLVQQLLPAVTSLNQLCSTPLTNDANDLCYSSETTTSYHYAVVESDHPYKPATVAHYKASFPDSVKWMTLEFDNKSGTAQAEDTLQIMVPSVGFNSNPLKSSVSRIDSDINHPYWPVLKKLSGSENWPHAAIVLPGNEVIFSLETATDYMKDEKANFYGFKCNVIGYEWIENPVDGLKHLEKELSYIAGMCAASLMKKDLLLPPASLDEMEEDLEMLDNAAQKVYDMHSVLLSKGISLSHPPTIYQALEGVLPVTAHSNELSFLKDFVACTANSSGGRLARWLQPDSYVDPKKCDVVHLKDDVKCGWPTVITILTKDQYGDFVHVPNLKVQVKAVPIDKKNDIDDKRKSKVPETFGGHPAPNLDIPYEPTIKEKMCYYAISVMKPFEKFSFEELRYMTPTVKRPNENMLVRPNNDSSYSANWTPSSVGWYSIHVTIDGFVLDDIYKVEVKDPPQGMTPPCQALTKKSTQQPSRVRKLVAKYSAGLRIRSHPSLQSEQIGIIPVNGVISFVDEIHNNDGIWLCLSSESVKKYCQNNYTEAWCLQYHQHYRKTFLVPLEEPKVIMDVTNKEPLSQDGFFQMANEKPKPNKRSNYGPGLYDVVRCGASGHNIRSRPTLKSPPVGMLVLGSRVNAVDYLHSSEGTWVKLDEDAMCKYCFNIDGEAWSLAQCRNDVGYLQKINGESNDSADDKNYKMSFESELASFGNRPVERSPGFDFSNATSNFRPSSGVFHFGTSAVEPDFVPEFDDSTSDRDGSHSVVFGSTSHTTRQHRNRGISDDFSDGEPSPSTATKISIFQRWLKEEESRAKEKKGSMLRDPPPELQTVSVKELVKAIGESRNSINGITSTKTTQNVSPRVAITSRSSSPKQILRHSGITHLNNAIPATRASLGSSIGDAINNSLVGSNRSNSLSVLQDNRVGSPRIVVHHRRGSSTQSDGATVQQNFVSCDLQTPHSPPSHESRPRNMDSNELDFLPDFIPKSTTQTGTQTSPPDAAIKAHFTIGSNVTREESLKVANKIPSKDRTARQLRSKRVEKTPNSERDGHLLGGSVPTRDQLKEALSPSVAESLRAVFSSFLWHEGIVHDAMACASFLKFHPNLTKQLNKLKDDKVRRRERTPSTLSKEQKARLRHSVEVSASSYLSVAPSTLEALNWSVANANTNKNQVCKPAALPIKEETVYDGTYQGSPPRQARAGDGTSANQSKLVAADSNLPPALQHLVVLWEEVSVACKKAIAQQMIVPSPMINEIVGKETVLDNKKENNKIERDKKQRKKKEWRSAAVAMLSRKNLSVNGSEKELLCELCGYYYPTPLTYHMRQAHPGCRNNANGFGYNRSGAFCGGWAGQCGEGGIMGMTWYLLCQQCREKYMKLKRQMLLSEKAKKAIVKRKHNRVAIADNQLEAHHVMKDNAMFLLQFSCASNDSLRTLRHSSVPLSKRNSLNVRNGGVHSGNGGANHDITALNPFPPVFFHCLHTLGVNESDWSMINDTFFQNSESFLNLPNTTGMPPEVGHSTSVAPAEMFPNSKHSDSRKPSSNNRSGFRGSRSFHRSMSIGVNPHDWPKAQDNSTAEATMDGIDGSPNKMADGMLRKRNNSSGCSNETGLSLLCNPSSALTKLVNLVTDKRFNPAEVALHRPVMSFILQKHGLESLHIAINQAVRKAACRVYAMQALNWLLRSVTQPTSLHDLLWCVVAAMINQGHEAINSEVCSQQVKKETDQEGGVCEHPLSDITICGDSAYPLPSTFHSLLQTISDLMMLLPLGSSLQQMAMRCWCINFLPSDHAFLHRSHVFSNISKILSRSEDLDEMNVSFTDSMQVTSCVERQKDLSSCVDVKASSRQAMVSSLTDNCTDTFWESGDEDRNKTKTITLTCSSHLHQPKGIYVHVDNSRDLGQKVTNIVFKTGPAVDDLTKQLQVNLESRQCGWVYSPILDPNHCVVKLELKGPDNTLRLRQIKVMGAVEGESLVISKSIPASLLQQRHCESETLKVFRILTSQVFGKLISGDYDSPGDEAFRQPHVAPTTSVIDDRLLCRPDSSNDLREHMVGILFSRSKLTHLQQQVCTHIVHAIRKEAARVRDEWEAMLCSKSQTLDDLPKSSDAYCFEMLSMVLALSGSGVGRQYLAHQYSLLKDLLSLLHTGSARVQRQVTSLLRRVLPEVLPEIFANILGVPSLPQMDINIVTEASSKSSSSSSPLHSTDQAQTNFDMHRMGILDVFLSCIAKSLNVQMKVKNSTSGKGVTMVSLATSIHPRDFVAGRWWLRGCMSRKLAEVIISLLKDMASGKLSEAWATVTKDAVAENILALTKLEDRFRNPSECVKTPTLWLSLASLCVLNDNHVERLTSGQWIPGTNDGHHQPRPTCDNHDDSETIAIILCSACGNLCIDCDRFLHLHRRTRTHQRQVFKEEEEAIKVDLHEGCGRVKLYWVMVLADSQTLKAMIEFREGDRSKGPVAPVGTCRFCGAMDNSGILAIGNVCSDRECQEHNKNACTKTLACGHMCQGARGEFSCLPCLHGCDNDPNLKQDADDMCMICFTEALVCAPSIQLRCGHVFHLNCCKDVLNKRCTGPRITFGFCLCPVCKCEMDHPLLQELLIPIRVLYEDVRRKAMMRLEYEGLHKTDAIVTIKTKFYNDPSSYAMDRYAYYVCYKCNKAYYGGEARCDVDAGAAGDDYDPAELVCGACSDVTRAQMCPKHGTDFLEYKCRYCCSVAVFFCFGTTHFCNTCHDDFQRVTNIPKHELPHCPAGPKSKQIEGEECPLHVKHPPTGEEFALGCGICRNAHTF